MANWGTGIMYVKGKKENIERFIKYFDYQNDEKKCFSKQELICTEITVGENEKDSLARIDFNAGWSAYSSFMKGDSTYYETITARNFDSKNLKEENNPTCVENECLNLGLTVEIWFEELNMGFQEHYLINNKGEVIVNEEKGYTERYLDDALDGEYAEYEEFKDMTEEEIEKKFKEQGDGERITSGGFENWGDCTIRKGKN